MLQESTEVLSAWSVQTHISVAIPIIMRCKIATVISMCYQHIDMCCNRSLQRHFRQRMLDALV
jgi:hypothetical protein